MISDPGRSPVSSPQSRIAKQSEHSENVESRVLSEHQIPSEAIGCPLCATDDWTEHARYRDVDYGVPGLWRIVRCRQCDLLYLNPRPRSDAFHMIYPANSVYFQMELRPDTRWLMKKAIVTAYEGGKLRELERCGISQNSRVLDVGCGGGFFLTLLKQKGWNAVGVEPNSDLVKKATAAGLDVRQGTLVDAALEPASFDAITLWHALEHDPAPRQTLARCRSLLKPGGCVVIQVPDFGSWEARRLGNYFWGLDLPRHLLFFTEKTLATIGKNQGFEIEQIRRARNPTSWLWSLLRWTGWDWYAEMEKNIGKITAGYLLIAPLYYTLSRGDWLTAVFRQR